MTDALNCIGNRDPVPDEPTSTRKLPRGLGPARVDIIIVGRVNSTTLAMKATASIPNVMTVSVDPIATGLVASLARPGGNVTGLAVDTGSEILGKRFDILKETLPNLSRLAIMFNPDMRTIGSG